MTSDTSKNTKPGPGPMLIPQPPLVKGGQQPDKHEAGSDTDVGEKTIDLGFIFSDSGFRGNADLVLMAKLAFLCGLNLVVVVDDSVTGTTVTAATKFLAKVFRRAIKGYTRKIKTETVVRGQVKIEARTEQASPLLDMYDLDRETGWAFVHVTDGPFPFDENSYLCTKLEEPAYDMFVSNENSGKDMYQDLQKAVRNGLNFRRYTTNYKPCSVVFSNPGANMLQHEVKKRDLDREEVLIVTRMCAAISELLSINPINSLCVQDAMRKWDEHRASESFLFDDTRPVEDRTQVAEQQEPVRGTKAATK